MKSLTIFFVLLCAGACAQVPRLDSLFTTLHQYQELNGNVLVSVNGQAVYQKSFGYANLEKQLPNGPTSEFTLASVSKVFTSTAILQLKEKGKLKLDDKFSSYFPAFPFQDITIRHLLSHTSGLPDYEIFQAMIAKHPDTVLYNKDIIPALQAIKLQFQPGEKWAYSNLNFCLLALLVEKLSHQSFEQYLAKNIFIPAKMTGTYLLAGDKLENDPSRTVNYDYATLYTAKLSPVDSLKKFRWRLYNLNGLYGQGNLITATADLLKFDQALYSNQLLKAETLNEAFTPVIATDDIGLGKTTYGLGWFILTDQSMGKVVFHTGGVPGCVTIFLRNISKQQTVAILDNAISPGIYRNGLNALRILNNQPFKSTKRPLIRDYGTALVKEGADIAFTKLQQMKADTLHYTFKEDDMNELGLRLLIEAKFEGHQILAAEVLKLNTVFFPNSFNTYDSYGQCLATMGKNAEAIWMYEKSLLLNPKNEGGKRALQRLRSLK